VWHRATRELRESGALQVVGLVQEQHPDRTRLYAQWQQLGWPILWDPVNTTNSAAVPRLTLLDENGDVLSQRPQLETIAELVATPAPAIDTSESRVALLDPGLLPALDGDTDETELPYWRALSDALAGVRLDEAVATLDARLAAAPDDARAWFRSGVVCRMRVDADDRPGEFQRAIDAWSEALRLNPRQYIWRRRIQQYGPLLDKPYPFYPWIDEAAAAIRARGEEPVTAPSELSESERVARAPDESSPSSPHADITAYEASLPKGAVQDDSVHVETVVVPDTDAARRVVRLYVTVRGRDSVLFDGAAGDLRVTFAPGDARPARWGVSVAAETLIELGTRRIEVDVWLSPEGETILRGDVVVPLRDAADGAPRVVRARFDVSL